MQVSKENPADTILTVNLEFECCMKSFNLKCKYQMQVHFVSIECLSKLQLQSMA